ncbi:MAG: hypothetical protein JWM68_1244 [Verrucomicrobiales bacterium]|nr:hypothetical protein [Verrucomicrobiales bacterium]
MKYKIELLPKSVKNQKRYTYQIWDADNELVCEMNGFPTTKENATAEAIRFAKDLKNFKSFEVVEWKPSKTMMDIS